jgi:hypothetical protein
VRRPSDRALGIPSSLRADFRALAVTLVPLAAGLDDAGWLKMETIVDQALASRPPSLRRKLVLFVRLLAWLSAARYGRSLRSLDARRRQTFLAAVERPPLLLVRRGFWGLRALVFLGYWTQPEAVSAIGYRAQAEGWSARR